MRTRDIPTAMSMFGQIDSTLARKYEGTGLGIPLSKAIIELHDGTLDLESTLGRRHRGDDHPAPGAEPSRRQPAARRALANGQTNSDEKAIAAE